MREYNEAFRNRMVQRMSGPHAVTATSLAAEVGVNQSTLSRWLAAARNVDEAMAKRKKSRAAPTHRSSAFETASPSGPSTNESSAARTTRDWTAQAKVEAVLHAASLSGDALGAWLRSEGLHDEDLARFREEVRAAAVAGLDTKSAKSASAADAKRIKELERELKRSKEALAETAALLVLRKKASALWGEEGDDT